MKYNNEVPPVRTETPVQKPVACGRGLPGASRQKKSSISALAGFLILKHLFFMVITTDSMFRYASKIKISQLEDDIYILSSGQKMELIFYYPELVPGRKNTFSALELHSLPPGDLGGDKEGWFSYCFMSISNIPFKKRMCKLVLTQGQIVGPLGGHDKLHQEGKIR